MLITNWSPRIASLTSRVSLLSSSLAPGPSLSEAVALVAALDKNGDGELDRDEIMRRLAYEACEAEECMEFVDNPLRQPWSSAAYTTSNPCSDPRERTEDQII